MSLLTATNQSLDIVQGGLEASESDYEKQFQLLKEIVKDLCVCEMNICLRITKPAPSGRVCPFINVMSLPTQLVMYTKQNIATVILNLLYLIEDHRFLVFFIGV
jgi:hypothetical protein